MINCRPTSVAIPWRAKIVPSAQSHHYGAMKYRCQCCGYLTLEDPVNGSYEICSVCFWENDEVQNDDPSYAGGANEPSLMEARRNFERWGAVEPRFLPFVRTARPDEFPPRN